MLYSMTGYGKSSVTIGDKPYTLEIKSLNSKQLDLNFRLVADLREKELEVRKRFAEKLIRGKVDFYLQEDRSNGMGGALNFSLIEQYYQQIQQFAADRQIPTGDLLPAILRFQDISKPEMPALSEEQAAAFFRALDSALDQVQAFRRDEGAQLEQDLRERVDVIRSLKNQLGNFEAGRLERLRDKLRQDMERYASDITLDKNRFEEEMIYYLEKLDINEEKVRLDTHLNYFMEMLEENSLEKGKKLGFIAQEMGREINTIGSKASDAGMQKLVVLMKEELEKIKEQVLNVL